jgi:predicted alpha/beta hydrolase family esterase
MRYLQKLPEKTKVGGALFVAGWFKLDNLDEEDWKAKYVAIPWTKTKLNFEKIRKHTTNFKVLISTDEPYGFVKENANTFRTKLKANVIIKNKLEHFCDEKMPIILNTFLKISK